MGHLPEVEEYLDETSNRSTFNQAQNIKQPWEFHLHGHRMARATIINTLPMT